MISVLERLLSVDRHRRKMVDVGVFTNPVVVQIPMSPDEGPWVTSLSTGQFAPTYRNEEGYVGQAFHECPVSREDLFLGRLYKSLWDLSVKHSWGNRASSIEGALSVMAGFGLEPKALVVPYSLLQEVTGSELTEEEADKVSLAKGGCVAEVQGIRVYSSRKALPDRAAILVAAKPLVGVYTRIHEHLAVTICRANCSMVLVGEDAVVG